MKAASPLSITREAADCRAAFKGVPVGALVQHCHHEQWIEILTEPPGNRIAFILSDKPQNEQAARLRLFRPLPPSAKRQIPAAIKKAYADWQKADADWQKAYADLQKAYADLQKAGADWQNAYADLQKAYADWQKRFELHAKVCGCPWGPKTDIFGKVR